MTLRSKMVATISAFCLVLAMLIIGVWAAQNIKIEMGGSLTFNANDVNVKIEGTITGTSEPQTLDTLIFSANDGQSSGDVETWKNKSLTFGRDDDNVYDIVIAIKITNLSKENAVNVKILDNYQTIENVDKTIVRDDGQYTAGSTYNLPKSTTESESTTTFKITFSVANKNQPVNGVQFGYTIDLSDESYKPPLGEVLLPQDNGDGTVTLAAIANEGAQFVGWQDSEGNFVELSTFDEYLCETYMLLENEYSAVTIQEDFWNNYFVDYSLWSINDTETWTQTCSELRTMIEGAASSGSVSQEDLEKYLKVLNDAENRYFSIIVNQEDATNYTAVFIDTSQQGEYTDETNKVKYTTFKDVKLAVATEIMSNSPLEVEIQSEIDGCSVIGICQKPVDPNDSFVTQNWINSDVVSKIKLPNTILELPYNCFCNCESIQEVILPNNLEKLPFQAFYGCSSLSNIELTGLKYLGESAFLGTGLTSIVIPSNVIDISSAFSELTSVVLESNIPPKINGTTLLKYFNKSLGKIFVPAESVELYKNAEGWEEYSSNIVSIERKVEDENFVYYIKDDNTLEVVGFNNGAKTEVKILSNIEGKEVSAIGEGAFYECKALEILTLDLITPPEVEWFAFGSNNSNLIIYVPAESLAIYQEYCNNGTNGWSSGLLDKLQAIV